MRMQLPPTCAHVLFPRRLSAGLVCRCGSMAMHAWGACVDLSRRPRRRVLTVDVCFWRARGSGLFLQRGDAPQDHSYAQVRNLYEQVTKRKVAPTRGA